MEDYWNNTCGYNAIVDSNHPLHYNSSLKYENYQTNFQSGTNGINQVYGKSLSQTYNQNNISFHPKVQFNDSLEERLNNTIPHIDENKILSCLSSPEPEIEELLFPDLQLQNFNVQRSQVQQINWPRSSLTISTQSSDFQSNVEVILYHKPRGCKGIWQKVSTGEPLRVTKGKGKWLKIEIRSQYEIRSLETDIFLIDITNINNTLQLVHSEQEGITIESKTDSNPKGAYAVEVEMKLDRVCKKLQFWTVSKTPNGLIKGKSVEFAAHNNGKASCKLIKEEPESISSESSSSSSSSGGQAITVKKKRRFDPIYEDESIPSRVVPGSLKVNGVVRAKAFLQYSDLRLKANVTDLIDAVNIVSQLKGRTFTWKDSELDTTGGKRVIGLIAQEVRRVIPEVVHETETGYLSVAYAEIVPILIEAFKAQTKQYNTDKEEVRQQLQVMGGRLEIIASILEKDQLIQQKQEEKVQLIQLQQQQQQLLQMQQQQQLLQHQLQQQQLQHQLLQQPVSQPLPQVIPTPLKGIIFNVQDKVVQEPSSKSKTIFFKKSFLKIAVIITFIIGIMTINLGAILLGITLSSPDQTFTTSVIQASNLKSMDSSANPDPYCDITLGPNSFRTNTIWNSKFPQWDQSFSILYDSSITTAIYQLYDENPNSYFPPRRMGYVTYDLTTLNQDDTITVWLTLLPNIQGDTVTGSIQVSLYLSSPTQPSYEILLLFAGIFLTSISLGIGFYIWRSGKKEEKILKNSLNNVT